jgi:hypothetical protein
MNNSELYFLGSGTLPSLGDYVYEKSIGSSTYTLGWPSGGGNYIYLSDTLGVPAIRSFKFTSTYSPPVNGYVSGQINEIYICPTP